MGVVSGVLKCVKCYNYCYCCCSSAILKSKMLNVYFSNKNEKMFQIDLNSDLREEPELINRCWFTLFGLVMQGS